MTPPRFVAIHGHFYQPPRESPWLERIEVQESAAPYHDWNERVTAECYAPNTAARRVDAENRILDIVDNFASVAFDVGPTLMAWLEAERPDVYAAVLEADRVSRLRRGHGNAIAQAYGHAILPLCSRRDKVTQVRWGLADFRHRFGREASGLWLPETAVDRETLEVLAEEGVGFTLLAPGQAESVREPAGEWRTSAATLDPRHTYRYRSGSGRELALFFYDGPLSHGIAFDGLLRSGEAMATRLLSGFDDRPRAQLVHVATDGETYGHHHRFGEMALADACHRIETSGAATLTNHGAFLAAHPPTTEARVVEGSSWSCVHGVERWRADCGCRAGRHPGWHQRWRGPLRDALDWLRDTVDPLYEARASALCKDPWAARDEYVDVLLDPRPASVDAFLARHALRTLDAGERVQFLRCLELQRHRLLMYTSCGWFFDEISGIETVQILRYAARVLQLARELGGDAGLEAAFLHRLAAAPSNLPELRDGAGVWRRYVAPSVTTLARVAAHYALDGSVDGYPDPADVYAYRIERLAWTRVVVGSRALATGRVRVTAQRTTESEELDVTVLEESPGQLHCRVRAVADRPRTAAGPEVLLRDFVGRDGADWPRALAQHVGGRPYTIADVFPDERQRLIGHLATRALEAPDARARGPGVLLGLQEAVDRWDGSDTRELRAATPRLLARAICEELVALAAEGPVIEAVARIRALVSAARSLGVAPDVSATATAQAIASVLRRVLGAPGEEDAAVPHALAVLDLGALLEVHPDLWAAQNTVAQRWRGGSARDRTTLAPLMAALGFAPESFAPPSPVE